MNEKKYLSKENIAKILNDSTITVNNMDDLIEKIKNDPYAEFYLRRTLIKDNVLGVFLRTNDDMLKYLKENYYIDEIVVVECNIEDEDIKGKIVFEMESDGYKSIIAEPEEKFSSVEVRLIETNVIETGVLKITWRNTDKLDLSKVLIMEKSENRVLAVGHLFKVKDCDNKFWCVFDDREYIFYDRFEGQNQVRLVVFTEGGIPHSCIAEMDYIKMETEMEKPLCIDFGTSNTTAGSYGIKTRNDVETVKFVDVTVEPHNTEATMLPTVVYVEDCSDINNIRYLFGYEALKRIEQEEHYEFKASAFFEIKRWMTSPSSFEEIRDNNNNKAKIERKNIIKAYIDYVIEKSEQFFGKRFDKIHFSAPVKLKSLFITTFKELYKNEKIVLNEKDSIDEAFAIVYNQIINIIDHEKKSISDKNILIMDCGGGTTDLANCNFSYTQNDGFTDVLKYSTRFENGNPNFGGNNITYRVMQLLKIKIASGYDSSIKKDAMLLINKTEDEILNTVELSDKNEAYNSDECSNEIYKEFVDEYNRCESIIPTKFSKDLDLDSYEIRCRKRNFYCMWRLAEKIKIVFFNTIKVQFDFCDQEIKELLVDSTNDYFYVNKDNMLVKEDDPLKNVTITNKDVERIICGDIYGLLYGLMKNGDLSDDSNKDRKVENFDYYKLSGQSCKIPMFKELLKEYIPGRKLRPYAQKKGETDNKSETLKLECLQGCIKFIKDQRGHELSIVPQVNPQKIIYNVYIINEHAEDKKIFDCENILPESTVFEFFNQNADEMTFEVRNKDGAVENKFSISLDDKKNFEAESADKLLEDISSNYSFEEKDINTILDKMCEKLNKFDENTKVLFCVPSPDYYGISIFLIQRNVKDGTSYYKLLNFFDFSFENPDKTFFDGKR